MARQPRKYETTKCPVDGCAEIAASELRDLQSEMEDWFSNLPESFQGSDKGQTIEQAGEALSSACDAIEGIDYPGEEGEAVPEVEVRHVLPRGKRKPLSRADRCANAVAYLYAAKDYAEERVAEFEDAPEDESEEAASAREEKRDAWQEWADALEEAANEAENVEFPGMFG